MKFRITLTWSKLTAFIVVMFAFILDMKNGGSKTFTFSIPFVVILITGRQIVNSKKTFQNNKKE